MRVLMRLFGVAVAAGAVLLVSASVASANPPQATNPPEANASSAGGEGMVNTYYDGPGFGVLDYFGFTKRSDSGTLGGEPTSVVDFTLPAGITVPSSQDCQGWDGFPNDNYCLWIEGHSCALPTGITVDNNTVSFQIVCGVGDSFRWGSYLSSFITVPGFYPASVQFKVDTYKRTKNPDNMWQISPANFEGAIEVCPFCFQG